MGTAQLLAITGLSLLPCCPASVPSNQQWWAESFSSSSLSDPFLKRRHSSLSAGVCVTGQTLWTIWDTVPT